MEPLIRHIGDTARWVAVYRADETDRPDAVFRDPYARKLSGIRGEQIVQAMQQGRLNSWSFVARTWLFDQFVLHHVQQGYEVVLNLASGLDTRPYRLNLPASLQWIDLDLPEITDYMTHMMANEQPACELQRIPIDLADRAARLEVFHNINQRNKKILVVAEGLVGYLDDAEAGALAYDLSHCSHFHRWVLDLMSPGILPLIQQEMGSLLDDAGTPLKFAPEEGEDFFRLFGWKLIESRSKLKTADQLNRLNPELKEFAKLPEPAGPKGNFPWSGVSLFENTLF